MNQKEEKNERFYVVEYFRQFSFNQTTTIVTQRMTTRYRIYKLKENAC